MSSMQIFYGTYKKSDRINLPSNDEDELYDLEEELGVLFIDVDGELYEATEIEQLESHGFILDIPPSDENRIICYWYNGGAGIHEVLESAIKNRINFPDTIEEKYEVILPYLKEMVERGDDEALALLKVIGVNYVKNS